MGRPTEITTEVIEAVVRNLATGAPIRLAAAGAGIAETTYHRWRQQGHDHECDLTKAGKCRNDGHPFREFREQTDEMRAKTKLFVAGKLYELVQAGDFQAIKFWLSHADRDNWYPKTHHEVELGTALEVIDAEIRRLEMEQGVYDEEEDDA